MAIKVLLLWCWVSLLFASFSIKAQSTVHLASVTQAEGLNAVFECEHSDPPSVAWTLNGMVLSSSNSPDGVIRHGTKFLTIPALPEHDGSVIQCTVFPGDLDSPNATYTVLRVSILNSTKQENDIIIFWNAKEFTTNITFCVDVHQTVLGPFKLNVPLKLHSMCGMTGPEYTLPSPMCDGRFSFTVTPADGDMRGIQSDLLFTHQTESPKEPIALIKDRNDDQKEVRFDKTVLSCLNITMALVDSPMVDIPIDVDIDNAELFITFLFPTDKHAQVNITLMDVVNGIELTVENKFSTFDIQAVSANNCSQPNTINVTLEYAIDSRAPGALLILVPIDDAGDMKLNQALYHIVPHTQRSLKDFDQISAKPGQCYLYAFDLENYTDAEQLLRQPTSAASVVRVSNVSGNESVPSHPVESPDVNVSRSSDGVTVMYTGGKEHLILTHSHRSLEDLKVHPNGGFIPVTDLPFSTIVFTWSDSIANAEVLLAQQIVPSTVSVPPTSPMPEVRNRLLDTPGFIAGITLGLVSALILLVTMTIVIILAYFYKHKHYSQGVHKQMTLPEAVVETPTTTVVPQEHCIQNKDPEMYAQLNLGDSKNGCNPVDTDNVVYSQIDHSKSVDPLAAQRHNYDQVPPPALPQEPTIESLAEILDPISLRWREIGKALGLSQGLLQTIDSQNDYHKIKIHEVVQQYFEINQKPKWIDIAISLRHIGEIEPANKIERTFNLLSSGCECSAMNMSMDNPTLGTDLLSKEGHALSQRSTADSGCDLTTPAQPESASSANTDQSTEDVLDQGTPEQNPIQEIQKH